MSLSFYSNPEYRKKQSEISHLNWTHGKYNTLKVPSVYRICSNTACKKSFQVKHWDPKKYCSKSCATSVNNKKRILSPETRQKISQWMILHPDHYLKIKKAPKVILICNNKNCQKEFEVLPYLAQKRKYCSNKCVMQVVGRLTTSPKASKGKPGIRSDIDPSICFYSTWEANFARVLSLFNIKWKYAPVIFDLGEHTYRPDFFLPTEKLFIEIKNFMGPYSLQRDQQFRQRYPKIKLEVILKPEYKKIESQYKLLIDAWE